MFEVSIKKPLEGHSPAVDTDTKLTMTKLGFFAKMPFEGHSPAVGTDAKLTMTKLGVFNKNSP